MTTNMIPNSRPLSPQPLIDRFVFFDDGSAVVHSMNGTHYALLSFERPTGIVVPHCDCKRSVMGKRCRHRRKCEALANAQGRIEAVWGSVDFDLSDASAEEECLACKEFVALVPAVYVRRSPEGNSGYHLSVRACGCGVSMGGGAKVKAGIGGAL